MDRTEKIKALELIQQGIMPAKYALNHEKYRILGGKLSDPDHYYTKDREKITKEDQEKYFPDAIIYLNVSKQFPDFIPIADDNN